jgi:hypothetical protein
MQRVWTLTAGSLAAIAALALLAALAACGGSASPSSSPVPATSSGAATPPVSSQPFPSQPPQPSDGSSAAAGTQPAPGLYEMAGGEVQAIGAVEYRKLEGGFWAVVGGSDAAGDTGKIVAVIVNGDEFASLFDAHPKEVFIVTGKQAKGTSTLMAGPEVEATKVVLAPQGGAAE